MSDLDQTRQQISPPGKSRLEQLPDRLKHQIARHLESGDSTRLALTCTSLCKFFFHGTYKSLGLHSTLCRSAEMGDVNFVHLAIAEGAKTDYKGTKSLYIGRTVLEVAIAAGQLPVILYLLCLEVHQKLGAAKVNKSIVYILANSAEVRPQARDQCHQPAWFAQLDLPSRLQMAISRPEVWRNLTNGDNSCQYGSRSANTSSTRGLDKALDDPDHCLALIKALLEPGVDVNGNCSGANMMAAIKDLWNPNNAKLTLDIMNIMLKRLYERDITGVIDKALRLACIDETNESSVELVKLLLQSRVDPSVVKRQDEIQGAVRKWWSHAGPNSSVVLTKILRLLTDHGFDRTVAGEISTTLGLEAKD